MTATPARRDFLFYATIGSGAVATGAAVWPLLNQMNPSADITASFTDIDISKLAPGSQITIKLHGKPIFIRRRTADEIREARAVNLKDLIDLTSQNPNKPRTTADDRNRTLDEAGEWLVMIGLCTHMGCVPLGNGEGDFNGWFCPCHGAHYDTAGRVRKGPAPRNLHIPKARFLNQTTIRFE